ncbi:pPIWI_RE module domain-containing protein [Streptomyces sp. NPDC054863]
MYPLIRTTAYEPDPTHGPWTEAPYVMRLGADLHEELTRWCARVQRQNAHPVRLPVRQLNSLLRASAPGVIATGRRIGTDSEAAWLFARDQVPQDLLAPLVGSWAAGQMRHHEEGDDESDGSEEEELLDGLDAAVRELPQWRREPVDLTATQLSAGGTAEPAHALYTLLPEWIASRLAPRPFHIGGDTLGFRVVSSDNGAELVSWPPQRHEYRKRAWYYSALVSITVHTVPFSERFRVHASTSIRRWATQLETRTSEMRGSTVLLDAPLPWPDGNTDGIRLIGNTIGFDRRSKKAAWRRHSPVLLLPGLDIVRHYPDPEELLGNPEKWINGSRGVAAGIVHRAGIGSHCIGPGVMPKERAELDAWVEDGLRPMLRRVPDLSRAVRHSTPALLPRSASASPDVREDRLAQSRRKTLAGALRREPLHIDILWQTPETRDALVTELPRLLGLPPGHESQGTGPETWAWRTDELDIQVRTSQAGAVASPLPATGSRRAPRAVRFAKSVADRRALVDGQLERHRGMPGLAIIEIGAKERFKALDSDPKHALRIACAGKGRLTQFINLPQDSEDNLPHRARSAWLDVFRQLGAVSPPGHRVGPGIPDDLQYVGLWLVRHTKKGPTHWPACRLVAVRIRPGEETEGVHGWDPERAEWVPYSQLLLALCQETGGNSQGADRSGAAFGPGTQQYRQDEIERQIRTLLFQLRDRPTLLLANSGNLRQYWPRLRNGALVKDMLGFGDAPDQRLAVYGPDLRIVLTRDKNGRGEVPEWYAHDGGERRGFAKGVWGPAGADHRVYASTADVPHTAALPKGLMKLVPTEAGRTAPRKSAWNPGLLEITVLGCLSEKALADAGREEHPADSPEEWANLTHQLRFHDGYPPLSRPLPQHLAWLAGEYVLPLAPAPEPNTVEA